MKKEEVLDVVKGFNKSLTSLIEMAYNVSSGDEQGIGEKGIKVHHLYKRPPLNSFVRGKAVIIGDAAHVMMPTHAAGGAVAIESAATMEVLFRNFPSDTCELGEFVKSRLKLFDQLRIPRCNLTMLASNAGPPWLKVPGVEEEIRKYYQGPLPGKNAVSWGKEFREFLFCYDAFERAEEAVRKEEEVAAAVSSPAGVDSKDLEVKVSVVETENTRLDT